MVQSACDGRRTGGNCFVDRVCNHDLGHSVRRQGVVRVTGSGYGLNTGEMGSVGGKIDAIKGHVSESAQDVGKTTIEAKDFGRAHTQAGGPFTELLTGLSTMVTAQATAMDGYTKRMRDATSAYDATEWQNSGGFENVEKGT